MARICEVSVTSSSAAASVIASRIRGESRSSQALHSSRAGPKSAIDTDIAARSAST
jgi:hypothetical protein